MACLLVWLGGVVLVCLVVWFLSCPSHSNGGCLPRHGFVLEFLLLRLVEGLLPRALGVGVE